MLSATWILKQDYWAVLWFRYPIYFVEKKSSGLQKNQPTKKEERVTVDQVINENVANQEDEEEVKKRKEEERQKWLEEQRIKYPIAPDGEAVLNCGYICNKMLHKRLNCGYICNKMNCGYICMIRWSTWN